MTALLSNLLNVAAIVFAVSSMLSIGFGYSAALLVLGAFGNGYVLGGKAPEKTEGGRR